MQFYLMPVLVKKNPAGTPDSGQRLQPNKNMKLQEKYTVLCKLVPKPHVTQHVMARTAQTVNEVLGEFLEEISCKYQASIGKVYEVDGVLKMLGNVCEACTSIRL